MSSTPNGLSTSAALRFTQEELGGPCTENESFPTVLTTANSVIAQGNGDRVGLIVLNIGANSCYIGLSAAVAAGQGLLIPASGGSMTLTVRDDFTLTSREWVARANSSSTTLYVLEIVRFKQGENTN